MRRIWLTLLVGDRGERIAVFKFMNLSAGHSYKKTGVLMFEIKAGSILVFMCSKVHCTYRSLYSFR